MKPKRSAEEKRKRCERERAEREEDRRLKPAHMFHDPGAAIMEAEYRPVSVQKDPVEDLRTIFIKLGRDFGGPLVGQPAGARTSDRTPAPM
jgi:hypothetical protein